MIVFIGHVHRHYIGMDWSRLTRGTHHDVRRAVVECVQNHMEWIGDEFASDTQFVTNYIMVPGNWAADS